MKKLSNKKLLVCLCVIILCFCCLGVLFCKKAFISDASAAKVKDLNPGQNEYNAIVNCGADSNNNKETLIQYFAFESELDKATSNKFKITVKRGKFISKLRVSEIIYTSKGMISSIANANGETYSSDQYVTVSENTPLIVNINKAASDSSDRIVKIEFNLAEDEYVVVGGNKYGCVGVNEFNAFNSGDSSILSQHPTLKDKPNGKDVGTFESFVTFEVPLNISNLSNISVNNDYYDTICSDYRGDSQNGYLSKGILSKIQDIRTNSTAYAQLQSGYEDCFKRTINGANPNEDVLKALLEDIVAATWVNYFGATSVTGSDKELEKFKDNSYFESIKRKALETQDSVNGSHYLENRTSDVSNKVFKLKCNQDASANFLHSFQSYLRGDDGSSVYNISANKQYFYTSDSFDKKYTYDRHLFTSGVTASKSDDLGTCHKQCEEAVIVEYGPPIASTAGLCFEYQVQVTSKIKCEVSASWEPIPDLNLCTPIPQCNYYYGFTHQAGPNEEFDACINKCDGGKYTEKCSDKCYNEVYTKPKNQFAKQAFTPSTKKATKVDNDANDMFAGRYTMDGAGNIAWKAGYYTTDENGNRVWVKTRNTYARYYKDYEYSRTISDSQSGYWHDSSGALYYYPDDYGFKRAYYGGSSCYDSCYFHGCSVESYLNKEELEKERTEILKARQSAIAECSASASCTTKTANFTMSVNYKHDVKSGGKSKEETVKIDFPYDTKEPDTIKTSEKQDSTACSGNPTTKLETGSHTILNYAGCYKNCGSDDGYHTRWSFPGGWTDTKSGEISYLDKSSDNTWTKFPEKFCVPGDAKRVNYEYFLFYYANKQVPSYTLENGKSVLNNGATQTFDPAKIDYNINAKATNFGHYGWNFEISCFYALDGGPTASEQKRETEIKPVDLTDLFPDETGSVHNNPEGFNTDDKDLPFNWSSRSIQKNGAIPTAEINPVEYGKYVQTKGSDIYNDDELEYHFHLTPSLMKDFNKRDYTLFSESAKPNVSKGINAYVSNFLRNTLKDAVVRIPSSDILGCNNIHGVSDNSTSGGGSCMAVSSMNN